MITMVSQYGKSVMLSTLAHNHRRTSVFMKKKNVSEKPKKSIMYLITVLSC